MVSAHVRDRGAAIPVIALTGHLGAGKTTLLNHILRTPQARIGVIVNDFGDTNVDAALVSGQIDEPASIAGGCICCLPDDGELDAALAKLADPKLRLDAIVIEASGIADPAAIARIIGFSEIAGVRDGGVVDVVDAARHFDTVDRGGPTPARYGASTLVVVNKLDQIPPEDRESTVLRVESRVRERNSRAHVIGVVGGRIDPALLYDVAAAADETGQLSFRDALVTEPSATHTHADAVTVTANRAVDPDALLDLLENPPAGVYRMKGVVAVRERSSTRTYVVNVVGSSIDISGGAPSIASVRCLVAIGMHLDTDGVRCSVADALRPVDGPTSATGIRRLRRYVTRH
jgi:G3E family GTPase